MELEQNLIEKFADPNLMMDMSVADKLKATAVTGLTGLGVTFIVLAALMLIILLFRRQISRYEMNSEYRRQVQHARKLRRAKLHKRQEGEQHGFETVEQIMQGEDMTESSQMRTAAGYELPADDADEPDEAIAAAIMAAICAHEGHSPERIQIRKITRRPYEDAAWKAGADTDNFSQQEGWRK